MKKHTIAFVALCATTVSISSAKAERALTINEMVSQKGGTIYTDSACHLVENCIYDSACKNKIVGGQTGQCITIVDKLGIPISQRYYESKVYQGCTLPGSDPGSFCTHDATGKAIPGAVCILEHDYNLPTPVKMPLGGTYSPPCASGDEKSGSPYTLCAHAQCVLSD